MRSRYSTNETGKRKPSQITVPATTTGKIQRFNYIPYITVECPECHSKRWVEMQHYKKQGFTGLCVTCFKASRNYTDSSWR